MKGKSKNDTFTRRKAQQGYTLGIITAARNIDYSVSQSKLFLRKKENRQNMNAFTRELQKGYTLGRVTVA